jgi:hypothetical protein
MEDHRVVPLIGNSSAGVVSRPGEQVCSSTWKFTLNRIEIESLTLTLKFGRNRRYSKYIQRA